MPKAAAGDLTARFNALRGVLQNEIRAGQDLASTRMNGMDAARQQYLVMLAEERAGLERRIQSVRDSQEACRESAQLQIDQRFAGLKEDLAGLAGQLDRRMETVRREAVTLQLQIDQRFETEAESRRVALETATGAIRAALDAAATAVSKAENATEKRFESVNEFRKTLTDQTATFPTRDEVSARIEGVFASVTRNTELIKDIELRLTSRLEATAAGLGGREVERGERRMDVAQTLQLLALLVVAAGVIISIVVR